jgi:hypothetical protein
MLFVLRELCARDAFSDQVLHNTCSQYPLQFDPQQPAILPFNIALTRLLTKCSNSRCDICEYSTLMAVMKNGCNTPLDSSCVYYFVEEVRRNWRILG